MSEHELILGEHRPHQQHREERRPRQGTESCVASGPVASAFTRNCDRRSDEHDSQPQEANQKGRTKP